VHLEEREWWAVASAIGGRRSQNGSVLAGLAAGLQGELFVDLKHEDLPREFARAPRMRGVDPRDVDRALRDLRAMGATILFPGHAMYPPEFLELEKPPPFLSCLGDVRALHSELRLAIVGSRELSMRVDRWMEQSLPPYIRESNVTIVSGGARGADQAAHLAAVRAERPTAVFLPSGLARIFPYDLRDWVNPILDTGGVFVSAYAPQETIRRFRFEARNRLIASVSHGVFVTEASRKSGSMMTARLAGELGRPIAVLPSFPGDLVGQGTLDLMIDGEAAVIRDVLDLHVFTSRLVPGSAKRPSSSESEECVGGPHCDVGRQLPFSGSTFANDVKNVIQDDQAHADNHAAGFCVSSVGGGS
jgi:DNA processing protein